MGQYILFVLREEEVEEPVLSKEWHRASYHEVAVSKINVLTLI